MSKVFALIDGNNFYASCERAFNPKLEGKPLVVLSNGDGCIIARSPEAKALGINMAQPVFKIRDFLKQHNVQLFSSNYELYGDMSRRLIETCKQYTPAIEIYSIDEAFLDFTHHRSSHLTTVGQNLRLTIRRGLGLPTCIGFGPTKALAKVANYFAKRLSQFNGVIDLTSSTSWPLYLQALPIDEVWGVGRQYGQMLRRHGVNTAWQFIHCDTEWVRKTMTVVGLRLQQELKGISCFALQEQADPKQMITVSRTFGTRVADYAELQKAIATFVVAAAIKLRKQNLAAKEITVFIKTSRHDSAPHISSHYTLAIDEATDYTPQLLKVAGRALALCHRPGVSYRKGGVFLTKLCDRNAVQRSLFRAPPPPTQQALMRAVDHLNYKMGMNTITYGSKGLKNHWQHRPAYQSPRYTTRWTELPLVRL